MSTNPVNSRISFTHTNHSARLYKYHNRHAVEILSVLPDK